MDTEKLAILAAVFCSLGGNVVATAEVSKPETESLAATGYVRVEQVDGVWWFIGPNGERFVSLGVNHIEPHLWLAPYNIETTLERYGQGMLTPEGRFDTTSEAAQRWIDRQVETAQDLRFNTFGKHTHPSIDPALYQDQIYYVASLETAPLAGWRERNGEGPRPDVFSRDFKSFLDERVQEVCAKHKDSPYLIGYLYTDVPRWIEGGEEEAMIYPWLNAILELGESSPGKRKWIAHLQKRYPSAEAAAKVWGLPVSPTYGSSWQQMARLQIWFSPANERRAQQDMKSFMFDIADQWYRLHYEAIRDRDPNHLILGDKNLLGMHEDFVVAALKKYVDVVAIQAYGRWAHDGPLADRIYERVGKPIFNGDGCFGVAQPNQREKGVKGYRSGATSLAEVANLYEETMEGMMREPYMIGWHHCGFLEQWDASERGDSPRNENGFMDPFENYHTVWTEAIERANANVNRWHAASSEP